MTRDLLNRLVPYLFYAAENGEQVSVHDFRSYRRGCRCERCKAANAEYHRLWRKSRPACDVEGCAKPRLVRGLCSMHEHRDRRGADLAAPAVERRGAGEALALMKEGVSATGAGPCVLMATGTIRRPHTEMNGKEMNASRAVWVMANGDPGELHVLHTCHMGQQGCIRLGHLYLGTNADNVRDREAGPNNARGEKAGAARLAAWQVREARALYVPFHREFGCPALARRYGVTARAVHLAVTGSTWAHIR